MNYKDILNRIEELKVSIADNEYWLPRLHSESMIKSTKTSLYWDKVMLAKYEAELPAAKAEWKASEIARLTAELEAIKAL